MPTVSVVLPVYNGLATIQRAIASIQNQTFADWELIILDDASSDGSYQLCQSIAEGSSHIRLYRNDENIGLAKTMNRLVNYSNGRYIAIQEQDDVSMPRRLELEVNFLETNPTVGLISGLAAWFDDDEKIFAYFPGLLQNKQQYHQSLAEMVCYLYIEQCKVVNAACMFRHELTGIITGPYDPDARMSIDWQFFLHAAHHTRIWGLHNVLVKMYRGQKLNHLSSNKYIQFKEARRCIRKFYTQYKDDPASPIDHRLYYQAMSSQLILEGRTYGSVKGAVRLLQAIWYYPKNSIGWESLRQLLRRGCDKLIH